MNKEELATKLMQYIDKGMDTMPAYMSDLISRYATYSIYMNLLGAVVFGGISIVMLIFICKKFKEYIDDDRDGIIAGTIIVLIVPLMITISCTVDLFKAIFVPELLLLGSFK